MKIARFLWPYHKPINFSVILANHYCTCLDVLFIVIVMTIITSFSQISCCFLEIALDQGCPIWGPRSAQNQSQKRHSLISILTHFEQGLCLNVLCNSDWLQFTAWPQFLHCFRWVKGVRYLLLVRSITLQLKL